MRNFGPLAVLLSIVAVVVTVYIHSLGYIGWYSTAFIILSSLFTIGFCWWKNRKGWWTPQRTINYAFILIWLIVFAVSVSIPSGEYAPFIYKVSESQTNTPYTWHTSGYPSISYKANMSFATRAIFSEFNPIQFNLTIFDVNSSFSLNDYPYVTFINGSVQSENPNPFRLKQNSDGSYWTNGSILVTSEGPIWFYLYHPDIYGVLALNKTNLKQLYNQTPALDISSASDTLNINLNEITIKVAVIVSSFSILLIAPLVESVVIRKPAH